jgi:acetyltransferase
VIKTLTDADIGPLFSDLASLLIDTVTSGASIGFHAPLADADAEQYWRGVQVGVRQGQRILVGAFDSAGRLVGSGQLALEQRPNGRHRAEVQKLMVVTAARRQGVARSLMMVLEQAALEAGRTLLVLDTREGDAAEQMYRALGFLTPPHRAEPARS